MKQLWVIALVVLGLWQIYLFIGVIDEKTLQYVPISFLSGPSISQPKTLQETCKTSFYQTFNFSILNSQLKLLDKCFVPASTIWVRKHPYAQQIRLQKSKRYLLVEDIHGFGNTICSVNRLLPLAILQGRQLLLVHKRGFNDKFFHCPLGKGQCWISRRKKERMQKELSYGTIYLKGTTGSNCSELMKYSDKDVIHADIDMSFQLSTCMKRLHNSLSSNYKILTDGLVKREAFYFGGSFIPLFFSRPSDSLLAQLNQFKQEIGWNRANLKVAIQYRTCSDCISQYKWPVSTYRSSIQCVERILDNFVLQNTSLSVFLASDNQKLMFNLYNRTKLAQSTKIHSFGHSEREFLHSEYHSGHVPTEKLLQVFMDWYMIGEADIVLASRSTFSTSACFRKGYALSSRVYFHSKMTGEPMCINYATRKAF